MPLTDPSVKILVVNDDGIHSRGLQVLASSMKDLGEIWIVAPEKPQNAVGRAITLHKPLRLQRRKQRVYAVNGTPADCVVLGIGKLLKDTKPALVISGINQGLNLGDDVANSGTVSASVEGMVKGIPSVAVSLDGGPSFKYTLAGIVAQQVASTVLAHGLPKETMLNVNIPNCLESELQGIKVTTLCRRNYEDPIIEKTDPRGGKYYWIAGQQLSWERGKHSDLETIKHNMVSITPLRLDLTQHAAINALRQWERSLNKKILGSNAKRRK